jgi:hypothetical protein
MAAARGDARHRRDMVGFQRVLHAQQKPQPQNSEHVSPDGSNVVIAATNATRLRCERSEAIQLSSFLRGKMDCFATLAMTPCISYATRHRICQSKVRAEGSGVTA